MVDTFRSTARRQRTGTLGGMTSTRRGRPRTRRPLCGKRPAC